MTYMVYEYGIKRIDSGEQRLKDQLFARTRYWNQMVELEKAYQQAKEAVLQAGSEGLALMAEQVAALESALAGTKHRTPERKVLAEALKTVRLAYREQRKALFSDPNIKAALSEAEQARRAAQRQARADTPLYWGTYLDVEADYKRTRQATPHRLKFHRPVPEGAVSVWLLSGGLPVTEVWGDNSMIQLDPVQTEAWESPSRSVRRSACRTTGRLRVGTDEARKPIYVSFSLALHRPLPVGSIIRHASIVRRRVDAHYKHTLTITVQMPETNGHRAENQAVAGIDLGWRLFPDRLRVGYVVNAKGQEQELAIPVRIVTALQKCDDILSIRDNGFNEARALLLSLRPDLLTNAPEWWQDDTTTLAQWRSKARLAVLLRKWREGRFDGDVDAYDAMEDWRKRDKHLWEYEAHLRVKSARRRREEYRIMAKRLVSEYGVLVLEKMNLKQMGERDDADGVKRVGYLEAAHRMRVIAAVGQFRLILQQTAAREGAIVHHVPSEYTTVTCWKCERRCDFDPKASLSHTCEFCGTRWDQDANAARNLLRLYGGGALANAPADAPVVGARG